MAAEAEASSTPTNGDGTSTLDALKPPAGVVLPPREIRNVLEKTAGYVARNGAVFEDRIRDRESSNPKFSFLSSTDAYHAFYQWRLSEIRAGRGTAVAAGRPAAAGGGGDAAEAEKPKGPPKPADFEFSARMPRINQKDLDVMRLTALFVAKNGRQFMTQLAQREAGNPQFQFLIPNHTLHNFFQHTVDQYTGLLRAGGLGGEGGKLQEERVAALEADGADRQRVLRRARQRAEYSKFQDQERHKREAEVQERKEEFARIDWGDFVVVETINFSDADNEVNLPPPTSLSELQYASLEDRNNASIGASMRIEEAMPGDEDHAIPLAQQPQQPAQPQQPMAAHAPQAMPPPVPISVTQPEQKPYQQPVPPTVPTGPGAIKIRENYVPRAAQKAANNRQTHMALCPNCKQQIPMDELEEHMRSRFPPFSLPFFLSFFPFIPSIPYRFPVANLETVELLDPSWKEQKAKADTRYAASNISRADVANNLKRLASQRSDVFDPTTGQAITEDELARRKRAALQSYDGNPDGKGQGQGQTGQMQSYNVEEQIRAIHQRFGDKR
ncbi:splicing factor 3A subunit 1 [Geosmithia morbida]|uniref:Splicing factor 3A subunit 1 n=1 Tax=Geosmithia morbida TaxID=1094350 RepID=A0A9P5D2V9_9HYPO|nr:splicing factor 3A subunit 1 [Geosmithia morbida]KAF4119884.1 splicing factor 3A subunit 1 [Geosmithia morbida]